MLHLKRDKQKNWERVRLLWRSVLLSRGGALEVASAGAGVNAGTNAAPAITDDGFGFAAAG
jgi:hypothetical protein